MRSRLAPVAAVLLGVALLGGLGLPSTARAQDAPPADPLESLDRAVTALADRCGPAVVRVQAVRTLRLQAVAANEEERREIEERIRRFGPRESISASGFLVDDSGLVLTTSAVAGRADGIEVTFPSGSVREGELVGQDLLAGVALLRVPVVEGVKALRLSEREARAGTVSLLLGPREVEAPVLRLGFVTSARRAFGLYDAWLVADLPLAAGQAGAPLLDARGDVLGMAVSPRISVTFLSPGSPASPYSPVTPAGGTVEQNLGRLMERSSTLEREPAFSTFVPASELRRIAADLRAVGYVRRGLLGVRMRRGEAVVREVPAGLPAAKAGIAAGDEILSVDGTPVRLSEEVTGFIQRRAPGTTVRLRLRAAGEKEREVSVVLAELPRTPVPRALFNGLGVAEREDYDLSAAKFQTMLVEGGRFVVVQSVAAESAAERAGILAGDWIVEIRGRPVLSEKDFAEGATATVAGEEGVDVVFYRAGEAQRRRVVLK